MPKKISISVHELQEIESRMRLKARASREMSKCQSANIFSNASKQSLFNDGEDAGVKLWMCMHRFQLPDDLSLMTQLADWFETTADSIETLIAAIECDSNLHPFLELVATTNANLQAMIAAISDKFDSDQSDLYHVLVDFAQSEGFFLPGLASTEKVPTENDWLRVLELIEHGQKQLNSASSNFFQLHLLKRAVKEVPTTDEEWQVVTDGIDELLAKGMKPNNVQLREILLPIFEFIPASFSMETTGESVLREIDLYLSRNPDVDASMNREQASLDVPKVRKSLNGQKVLLVGGNLRSEVKQRLIDAFGLKALVWLTVKPKQSAPLFTPEVLDNDYGVVLVSLRFGSHVLGQMEEFCKKTYTPLALLPAGYLPNQVADQILSRHMMQKSG